MAAASTPAWRAFDSCLIDAVRSKPVLYNTRLKEFRNNKIKENAWKAIAAQLSESGRHQWYGLVTDYLTGPSVPSVASVTSVRSVPCGSTERTLRTLREDGNQALLRRRQNVMTSRV